MASPPPLIPTVEQAPSASCRTAKPQRPWTIATMHLPQVVDLPREAGVGPNYPTVYSRFSVNTVRRTNHFGVLVSC